MRAVFSLSEPAQIHVRPERRSRPTFALRLVGVGPRDRNVSAHERAGHDEKYGQNESSHCSFSLNLHVRANIILVRLHQVRRKLSSKSAGCLQK
jgi:hypothetical protein